MSTDHDIQGWIQRARKGDRRAFDRIVLAQSRGLLKYCLFLTHDREWGRDLAQETWTLAWRRLGSYRHEAASFLTWLKTIAYHTFISQCRRRKLRKGLPDRPPSPLPGPLDAALERDLLRSVMERIARFSPEERRALGLHLQQGSYGEIADLLGISNMYARVYIYRLLKGLRDFFGSEDDDDRG